MVNTQTTWCRKTTQVLQWISKQNVNNRFSRVSTILQYQLFFRYHWDVTKFSQLPQNYWSDFSHQYSFLSRISNTLNISSTEQWFDISPTTFSRYDGGGLVRHHTSLGKVLSTVYPEYKKLCQDKVLHMVNDMKLSSIEDLIQHTQYLVM